MLKPFKKAVPFTLSMLIILFGLHSCCRTENDTGKWVILNPIHSFSGQLKIEFYDFILTPNHCVAIGRTYQIPKNGVSPANLENPIVVLWDGLEPLHNTPIRRTTLSSFNNMESLNKGVSNGSTVIAAGIAKDKKSLIILRSDDEGENWRQDSLITQTKIDGTPPLATTSLYNVTDMILTETGDIIVSGRISDTGALQAGIWKARLQKDPLATLNWKLVYRDSGTLNNPARSAIFSLAHNPSINPPYMAVGTREVSWTNPDTNTPEKRYDAQVWESTDGETWQLQNNPAFRDPAHGKINYELRAVVPEVNSQGHYYHAVGLNTSTNYQSNFPQAWTYNVYDKTWQTWPHSRESKLFTNHHKLYSVNIVDRHGTRDIWVGGFYQFTPFQDSYAPVLFRYKERPQSWCGFRQMCYEWKRYVMYTHLPIDASEKRFPIQTIIPYKGYLYAYGYSMEWSYLYIFEESN